MSNLISERITDLVPKRIYDEYTTRDDLQKLFNLNNFIGIINFYLWWKEYAEIKEYNYYWLPSIELSEKLFTSKLKNGIYSAHISIANRFKSKNECKKILSKGIISNIDYKKFKDWLRDSYYDVLPNNSYIFSDLSDLGKENLINNSKTKFISYKSNEYLIISDYLSLILLFLRSASYKNHYQIKIKELMIEKSTNISFEYLPEIMQFFNQKILANDSNIKMFFYDYLNQISTNNDLPIFLDILTKRKDIRQLYKENTNKELFMINWWYQSGKKEYKFANKLKINFSEKIKRLIDKKFLKKENISFEILMKRNIDEFIHNSKSFTVPSFLIYIYNKRSDLRDSFYKSELPFRLFILNWWISCGNLEYSHLKWEPLNSFKKKILNYLKSFELKILSSGLNKFEESNFEDYFLICSYYEKRIDLQNAFRNSSSLADSLYNWFINSGINEDEDLKNIKDRSPHEILPTLKKYFKNKEFTDKNNCIDPLKLFTVFERINNFFIIPDGIEELTIPSFLIYIYEKRPDIKNAFYKSELPFRLFIIDWWILFGREEYPDLKWEPSNSYKKNLLSYIKNLKLKITKSGPDKYKQLVIDDYILIFKHFKNRDDLQDAFKNSSSKSTSIYNWFINSGVLENENLKNIEGRSHYEIIPTLDKCFINNKINKPITLEPIKLFIIFERINKYFILPDEIFDSSIPAFLIYIYESRQDIKEAFYKCQLPFRLFIINWWIFYGIAEYPDLKWEPSTAYKKDLLSYIKILELKITNSGPDKYEELLIDESILIYRFYQVRSDLQDAFKHSSSISTSLYNWFINSGVLENEGLNNIKNKSFYEIIPSLERCLINKKIRKLNDGFYERLFKTMELIKNYFVIKNIRKMKLEPIQEKVKSSFFSSIMHKDILSTSIGVSDKNNRYVKSEIAVVGLHNYQLGISEDARNIYKSLSGIKKSIKASDIPIISKNKLVNLNYKLFNFVDSNKTIIVLPPTELVTLYLKNQLYFNSKTKYALIPWELPRLHRSFIDILSSFDLLLAPSKFIRNSLLEVHKNVKLLPHFIDLDKKNKNKKYKEFTFLYSADLNSFIKRKNPFCAIKAFKIFLKKIGKFNKNEPKLILRLSNLRDEQFKEINKHILNISNIILITKHLDREDYINLLAKSHCFVSPHRSEGFGRNIAEAMFLNTPVIASAYSGNLDFCFENNSYLINGKLIPLKRGDYPCCEDSSWFDPDYLHLSELMYEVYTNYDEAIKKSKLGQKTIENNHSLDIYKKNLKNLLI